MNITLPEELVRELDEILGPRKKSEFIAESLRIRIEKIRAQELEKILEEGYKLRKNESLSVAESFEPADLEGWDEY